jgi:hypothetical protein
MNENKWKGREYMEIGMEKLNNRVKEMEKLEES